MKFMSDDGIEFNTYEECKEYESNVLRKASEEKEELETRMNAAEEEIIASYIKLLDMYKEHSSKYGDKEEKDTANFISAILKIVNM